MNVIKKKRPKKSVRNFFLVFPVSEPKHTENLIQKTNFLILENKQRKKIGKAQTVLKVSSLQQGLETSVYTRNNKIKKNSDQKNSRYEKKPYLPKITQRKRESVAGRRELTVKQAFLLRFACERFLKKKY